MIKWEFWEADPFILVDHELVDTAVTCFLFHDSILCWKAIETSFQIYNNSIFLRLFLLLVYAMQSHLCAWFLHDGLWVYQRNAFLQEFIDVPSSLKNDVMTVYFCDVNLFTLNKRIKIRASSKKATAEIHKKKEKRMEERLY